ncbi:SRPBCC family protein [Albibacterium indicum]|uniref:SRPBCC family protein n=1 Tax=Albibacterium indicum TaxID=2292082 RepID=UPI000E532902|nr:SRPBCC domain-containing protein [Pedobacter indicus]
MKSNQGLIFSVEKANRKIHVEKEFAAPLEKVWDAFAKEDQISQWFAPKPWKVESKDFNFAEGGRWLFAMVGPEGEKHWSVSKFISIDPLKGYVASDAFSDDQGNINEQFPQSTWHADFVDKGDSTLYRVDLVFDSEDDLNANLEMGFQEGFTVCLNQLEEQLA